MGSKGDRNEREAAGEAEETAGESIDRSRRSESIVSPCKNSLRSVIRPEARPKGSGEGQCALCIVPQASAGAALLAHLG